MRLKYIIYDKLIRLILAMCRVLLDSSQTNSCFGLVYSSTPDFSPGFESETLRSTNMSPIENKENGEKKLI